MDGSGNLFIADSENNRIRRVDGTTAVITTVAGDGEQVFAGDGGSAITASLGRPSKVVLDGAGNLFIADSSNDRLRRVDAATGIITTVAGTGTRGFGGDGGPATSALIDRPRGLAIDAVGNLIFVDRDNHRIRQVEAAAVPLSADLSIAKSASPSPVFGNQTLTYTLTVTNLGPADSTSITVTDTLPGTVTFVSASAGCAELDGTVTCDIASLVDGASSELTITVTAPSSFGNITNTATVAAESPADPTPSNDSVTLVTFVRVPPGVPGVGTWGLVGMAALLAAMIGWTYRRRARTESAP